MEQPPFRGCQDLLSILFLGKKGADGDSRRNAGKHREQQWEKGSKEADHGLQITQAYKAKEEMGCFIGTEHLEEAVQDLGKKILEGYPVLFKEANMHL